MYSPQSHQLVVGSRVKKYTVVAIMKAIQPRMTFQRLKSLSVIIEDEFQGEGRKKCKCEGFFISLRSLFGGISLSDGVTGNTSDFGSEESRFEP